MKELLSLKGQQINIPVEQLKKQDADRLFTNLLLSVITPDTIKKGDHAISDISQRLEAIDTARKSERELAAE